MTLTLYNYGGKKTGATSVASGVTSRLTPFQYPDSISAVVKDAIQTSTPPAPMDYIDPSQNLRTNIKTDVANVFNAPKTPQTATLNDLNVANFNSGVGKLGSDIVQGWKDFGNTLVNPKVTNASPVVNAITAVGESGMGFVNAFFKPITGLFEQAATVPGPIGTIADWVNKTFSAAGVASSDVGVQALDRLPISPETKAQVAPLVREVSALAGQIALGKATDVTKTEVVNKTKTIISKISEDTRLKELNAHPDIQAAVAKHIEAQKSFIQTQPETPTGNITPYDYSKPATEQVKATPTTLPEDPTSPVAKTSVPQAGIPSYNKVATSFPETGISLPSLSSTAVKVESSTRYTEPSHLTADTISAYTSRARKVSQENAPALTSDIRKATGLEPNVRVKSEVSIIGKAERLKLRGKPLGGMSDVLAGRITVLKEDIPMRIEQIKNNFNVTSIEDYRKTPTSFGYSGVNIKVKLPNGMPAEIQIHTPESLSHANYSHTFYEKYRNVDMSKLSEAQKAQARADMATSNQAAKGATPKTEPTAGAPKPIEAKAPDQLASRVFERMKADNPQLEGSVDYNPIKLKEDAAKAVNLVATDKQKAYRIATGAESSSEVTSTAVNIAMTEKALSDGNYGLASKLIRNRSLEQTRRGQEIVAERGSVTNNSTQRYVKELVAARLDNLGKKYLDGLKETITRTSDKGKATKALNEEVAKVERQIKSKKLDVKTALSLLDRLTCI